MQQVFDIPQRKWKPDIHHHRKADDLGAGFEIAKWGAFCHGQKLNRHNALHNRVSSDKARSYGAAMKVIGNAEQQETGRWLNNQSENSHLPFRRRERAMLWFRRTQTLQKFVAVHSSVHNHFNQERHLYSRCNFKLNRTAALAEWRQLGTA